MSLETLDQLRRRHGEWAETLAYEDEAEVLRVARGERAREAAGALMPVRPVHAVRWQPAEASSAGWRGKPGPIRCRRPSRFGWEKA